VNSPASFTVTPNVIAPIDPEIPSPYPRTPPWYATWTAEFTFTFYDNRGNPVQGPDEEDRWEIVKEIWRTYPTPTEFRVAQVFPDPDAQGRSDDSQPFGLAIYEHYQTIVEEKNPGDRLWCGFDRLFFKIKRYNGSIVTYPIGQRDFCWIKDGPRGTVTNPGTIPPTLNDPRADDLRFEWE
jgi:hypothetical protein